MSGRVVELIRYLVLQILVVVQVGRRIRGYWHVVALSVRYSQDGGDPGVNWRDKNRAVDSCVAKEVDYMQMKWSDRILRKPTKCHSYMIR